ncbi:YidC/Oxa1 family insertase periplasmic-domain containing protein [Vibrio chagasii]|nr:YidC/Oxa1 family insertase periplasmic-domain containing protein [Vibrio chagasii]
MLNKTIANGDEASFKATLWVGPNKLQDRRVNATKPRLVVDYGWLWFIAKFTSYLLSFIQGFVSNWGCSNWLHPNPPSFV